MGYWRLLHPRFQVVHELVLRRDYPVALVLALPVRLVADSVVVERAAATQLVSDDAAFTDGGAKLERPAGCLCLATRDSGSGKLVEVAAGWAEGYFLSSIKRVGQALETRILLDNLFDDEPEANVLVCGDFNAEPGQVPVEAICGRVENTGDPDLRSRVLVPCSGAIPKSVRFSHYHHGHSNLLDHMLISQSLT